MRLNDAQLLQIRAQVKGRNSVFRVVRRVMLMLLRADRGRQIAGKMDGE